MVVEQLQRAKERRHRRAQQILAAISPHDAGYRGWNVAQHQELPDVACRNDDEKVGREGIPNGAQHRQVPLHVEGQHQDEEAQHEQEHPAHRTREAQREHLTHGVDDRCALIAWSNLEGGHATKEAVGPASDLAIVALVIDFCLLPVGSTLHHVVLLHHISIHIAWIEIYPRDSGKGQYREHKSDYTAHRQGAYQLLVE